MGHLDCPPPWGPWYQLLLSLRSPPVSPPPGPREGGGGDPGRETPMVSLGRIWGPPRAGPTTCLVQPPVLEEALKCPADPIALGRRE